MAFDGITIAAMVKELHLNLDGGRFNKIAQPEADELLITGIWPSNASMGASSVMVNGINYAVTLTMLQQQPNLKEYKRI